MHPQSSSVVMDIAPGFAIDGTTIVENALRQPVALSQLRRENARNIERANAYGVVGREAFDEVLALLRANVATCLDYLRELSRDYRFLVQFRNFAAAIAIEKKGAHIEVSAVHDPKPESYDIVY